MFPIYFFKNCLFIIFAYRAVEFFAENKNMPHLAEISPALCFINKNCNNYEMYLSHKQNPLSSRVGTVCCGFNWKITAN